MRIIVLTSLCCLLVTPGFGQHRGLGRGGFVGGGFVGGGFSRGGFRHGGIVPFRGFGVHRGFSGFAPRGFIGRPAFGFGFGGYWGGFGATYSYPAFVGYPYAYPYSAGPNVFIYSPPVEPVPPVILTQRYGREIERERPSSQYEPPIYLIALKTHVIYAALAYWVEGETLHYIDRENEHKQVPLDSIDRPFTLKLNRDRKIEMRLP